jgi:small-conductance mechanosensitive channel
MDWHQHIDAIRSLIIDLSWKVLSAIAVLIAGVLVAGIARRLVWVGLKRADSLPGSPRTAVPTFVYLGLISLSVILALGVLGVATTVIGAIVTLGIALGIMGDLFGALRLSGSRSIRIGDFIELEGGKVSGYVRQVSLGSVTLMTPSGAAATVPNRQLFDRLLTLYDRERLLRFHVTVEATADVPELRRRLSQLIKETMTSAIRITTFLAKIEHDSLTMIVETWIPPHGSAKELAPHFLEAAKQYFDTSRTRLIAIAPEIEL